MRTENQKHAGDIIIESDVSFSGQVTGSMKVMSGVRLELHGQVVGDLLIERGAVVELHGMVIGTVLNDGGKVTVSGWIGGLRDLDPTMPATVMPGAHIDGAARR